MAQEKLNMILNFPDEKKILETYFHVFPLNTSRLVKILKKFFLCTTMFPTIYTCFKYYAVFASLSLFLRCIGKANHSIYFYYMHVKFMMLHLHTWSLYLLRNFIRYLYFFLNIYNRTWYFKSNYVPTWYFFSEIYVQTHISKQTFAWISIFFNKFLVRTWVFSTNFIPRHAYFSQDKVFFPKFLPKTHINEIIVKTSVL